MSSPTPRSMGSDLVPPVGSPFPLHSLPLGIGRRRDERWSAWVALGDHALSLASLEAAGLLSGTGLERPAPPAVDAGFGRETGSSASANAATTTRSWFSQPTLNGVLGQGSAVVRAVRERVREVVTESPHELPEGAVARRDELHLTLPVHVGDYTDFYSSLHHATNLGRLFRPDGDPLLPNWRHLPVGYSGRAATIVADATEIVRPSGLRLSGGSPTPGPTEALDFELEVGVVVGIGSTLGVPVEAGRAEEHFAGVCLVNDWSARDIQAFEYQPLGPFCGKSFATSMSPWLVPFDALEPHRMVPPPQDPPVAPHLRVVGPAAIDLHLEVLLESASMRAAGIEPVVISRTSFADMYWTPAQQLAHLTSNGACVRTGDLLASGTVSGPHPGSEGSLIELTWRGERPLELPDGTTRAFLWDGDRVILRGWAGSDESNRIGLGSVEGTIVPTRRS